MQRGTQISIPKPCHEGWQNMLPEEKGRFCLTCQKSVVDFSAYTNTELLKYFSQTTGKTCGRFNPEQLNRFLETEKPHTAHRYYKFFASIALFLGLHQFSYSQTTTANSALATQQYQDSVVTRPVKTAPKKSKKDSLITISGQVIDSADNTPLYAVPVSIKNTSFGTFTDFDGKFSFAIPADSLLSNNILLVKYLGYITSQTPLSINKTNDIKISLSGNLLEGEVVVYKRRSPWKRFKLFVSGLFSSKH